MVEIFFWEDLERREVNPYEAVIGAAREARWINQSRRDAEPDETNKPTTLALRKVVKGRVKIEYLSPKEIGALEEAHVRRSRSEEEKHPSGGNGRDSGLQGG